MDAHKQHNQNAISSDFFLCIMISPSHTWTPEKMQANKQHENLARRAWSWK